MEKTLFMLHHMGMGDNILCNGIVRTYVERYDKLFLYCKPKYANNMARMYRDNPKIKLLALNDPDALWHIRTLTNNNYIIIGYTKEWFDKFNSGQFGSFDQGFYITAGVPFEDKWNKFYVERDLDIEKDAFYNKFKLTDNEEYLFVHDDPGIDRKFRSEYVEKGLKVIRPGDYQDVGIFDFIYTIEKAKEVHVMNSSFSCLIDTMQIYNDNLFYHEYARTDMGDRPNHGFKMNWKLIR